LTLLVLDTDVWLWTLLGSRTVRAETLEEMARAARKDELIVPVITVWEAALLDAKGRIDLCGNIQDWVAKALAVPGYQLALLTAEIAVLCHHLPGDLHAAPADRMMVATAIDLATTLVTRDESLLSYGAQGHVGVLAA
jgi:PIN domain nuclease of toxin-antitoxin system